MLELYDSRRNLRYVWNGAHTVNIYNEWGDNVDCFTFGKFDNDHPEFIDFVAAVNNRNGD